MSGNALVYGDEEIKKSTDLFVIGPCGSRNDYLTVTRKNCATGCFYGTYEQLLEKSGDRKWTKQYKMILDLAKKNFEFIDGK